MAEFIDQREPLLVFLGILSVLTFISTLVAVPWMVVRIPRDYFAQTRRRPVPWAHRHPVVRLSLLAAKNLLGGVFLVLGVVMLMLPGQGLLTILIGIILLDFPGKYRFERWLIQHRLILHPVNWLRERRGRAPLDFS